MTPGPYYHELLREAESISGIRSAVLADFVPFYTSAYEDPVTSLDGVAAGQELHAGVVRVTDGFFAEMGMQVVEGRDFRRENPEGAEPEAIVSRSLAERLGGAAAVGRHIRVGTSPEYQSRRIVGIASDAQFNLSDPSKLRPFTVYLNSWQHPQEQMMYPVLLLKTRGGPLPAAAVRQTIDRLGREYAQRIRSLDEEKDGALVENRVIAYLAGAFGVIALILAAVGLFGLLSYQVANRTGEIGIRMALGARPRQIQWLIVRQIAMVVSAGSAAGLGLALLAGKAIAGLLFGVGAADPALLAGAVAVLGAVALMAAWLPARRAASIDPQSALRCE
jgi:predicted lysophospholipase L1 biosynthesis ABC-type transport system permease subunit